MFLKKEKYTDKTVRAKKEEHTYGVIGLEDLACLWRSSWPNQGRTASS